MNTRNTRQGVNPHNGLHFNAMSCEQRHADGLGPQHEFTQNCMRSLPTVIWPLKYLEASSLNLA